MVALVVLYFLGNINHGGYPNTFFVCFKIMQQLAVRFQTHIDVMATAYAVEKENQQGMGAIFRPAAL
jgi:hypothetical protein